jgi:hypothetical protein
LFSFFARAGLNAMIQTRLISAALLLTGLAQASAALAAAPVVVINQGQQNACTVTPSSGTVFTLDPNGNVLVNGTYDAACPVGGGGSGPPTFSFNPNPSNLTIPSVSLPYTGGTINPNFVAYFANSCTGSVTQTTGCPAVAGNWGTGGTVCTAATNASGQKYCSPNSAAVTLPANSTAANCVYTFQATNCTNGTTAISTQTAQVTVPFNGGGGGGGCSAGDGGDLSGAGYTRQCSGLIASLNNSGLHPVWDNTYAGLMSGPWPGNTTQFSKGLQVTINQLQYASFSFNTGSTPAGVEFSANGSYGTLGIASISTAPGDFFSGTALCVGSTITISSKSNTVQGTNCKLQLNTNYYLNMSSASYSPPHDSTCGTGSCTTGWTTYSYGN